MAGRHAGQPTCSSGTGAGGALSPGLRVVFGHVAPGSPALPACRLEGLDLKGLQLRTLLVDPPRAGLDEQTVKLLGDFSSIVYISCNPGGQAASGPRAGSNIAYISWYAGGQAGAGPRAGRAGRAGRGWAQGEAQATWALQYYRPWRFLCLIPGGLSPPNQPKRAILR